MPFSLPLTTYYYFNIHCCACFRHNPFDVSDILADDDDDDDVNIHKVNTNNKPTRTKNTTDSCASVTTASTSMSASTGLKKYRYHSSVILS